MPSPGPTVRGWGHQRLGWRSPRNWFGCSNMRSSCGAPCTLGPLSPSAGPGVDGAITVPRQLHSTAIGFEFRPRWFVVVSLQACAAPEWAAVASANNPSMKQGQRDRLGALEQPPLPHPDRHGRAGRPLPDPPGSVAHVDAELISSQKINQVPVTTPRRRFAPQSRSPHSSAERCNRHVFLHKLHHVVDDRRMPWSRTRNVPRVRSSRRASASEPFDVSGEYATAVATKSLS